MRILVSLAMITVGLLQCRNAQAEKHTLTFEEARQRVAELKPADELDLSQLTSLSPEVAKELVQHEGAILLNGLKQISPETAEWLATHKGFMRLSGLQEPSNEVMGILGKHMGTLSLHIPNLLPMDEIGRWKLPVANLDAVTRERFLALATASTSTICLTGCGMLAREEIWYLSRGGPTSTKSERFFDWSVFSEKKKGSLIFQDWSWHVSPMITNRYPLPIALIETTAILEFPDLERIDAEDANTLVKHKGGETHLGIRTLDASVAKILACYGGLIVLPRMTALTQPAAAALKGCRARIRFPNLKTVTDETRALIRENPKIEAPALE